MYGFLLTGKDVYMQCPDAAEKLFEKILKKHLTNRGCRDIIIKQFERRLCPVFYAGVAQLVEQLICNQQVGGSSPSTSSSALHEQNIVDMRPMPHFDIFCTAARQECFR